VGVTSEAHDSAPGLHALHASPWVARFAMRCFESKWRAAYESWGRWVSSNCLASTPCGTFVKSR